VVASPPPFLPMTCLSEGADTGDSTSSFQLSAISGQPETKS
jgi:hypothetical protein